VRSQILPYIGEVTLQKLAAKDIDRMDAALRERGLRGKTRRNARGTLHKALGDAVRRGYVLANVADAVDPPAKDDSVPRTAWSAEEVRTFLEVATADRFGAVWRLALASGLRRGELCGLRWDDVADGRISVRRQVLVRPGRTWDEERIYLRETTKSRRVRTVNVDEGTAASLRRWKARQAEERLAFGSAYTDEGWIVAEADGSLVQPDTLSSRWKRLERLAGVRPIGLHGARHTHATLALAAGVRLDIVSKQLGHSSVAITADTYGHPDDKALDEAAQLVARAIEGRRGK